MRRFNESERLQQILDYLREKRAVTVKQCVMDLKLCRSTVTYFLNRLHDLGLVRKKRIVGSKSSCRILYELRGDGLDIRGISEINSYIQRLHNHGAEDEYIKAD